MGWKDLKIWQQWAVVGFFIGFSYYAIFSWNSKLTDMPLIALPLFPFSFPGFLTVSAIFWLNPESAGFMATIIYSIFLGVSNAIWYALIGWIIGKFKGRTEYNSKGVPRPNYK